MIKKLILIAILFITAACTAQVDTNNYTLAANLQDSRYSLVTNNNFFWGVPSGEKIMKLLYALNFPTDTIGWKLRANAEDGKYNKAQNTGYYWGHDSSDINAELVYLLNPPAGVSTSTSYTWTAPQTFSTLIADLIITNRVDSTTSIRLYDTSGTLYALFSADTSYIPNLTVGNLSSTTIINGSSVTTNSLISDTLISNSPLHLRTDSLFFGVLNDTSKVWYREITTANSTRGSIYPNINLGSDLGLTTNRFKNTYTRTLNADSSLSNYSKSVFITKNLAIADSTINCNLGNSFYKTMNGSIEYDITNIQDGQTVNVVLTNTASNYTATWSVPAGTTLAWSNGSAPVITVGAKTSVLTFIRSGTVIYGNYTLNY